MDFTEYQEKAFSTCTPECYTDEYLNYGYLSEAGEVAGKLAKRVRGDDIPDEAIMAELGDVAWMIAVKARKDGESLIINEDVDDEFDWLLMSGRFDGSINDLFVAHIENFSGHLKYRVLMDVCGNLGINFRDALKYNNDKLSSRQKRGVIQGDGDDR